MEKFPGLYKVKYGKTGARNPNMVSWDRELPYYHLLIDIPDLSPRYKKSNGIWIVGHYGFGYSDKLVDYYRHSGDPELEILRGKYISTTLSRPWWHKRKSNKLGFSGTNSIDGISDFKQELDYSEGTVFTTELYIYDFLKRAKRPIEKDGSIKLSSIYGDMRIYPSGKCCKYNPSNPELSNQDELDAEQISKNENSVHREPDEGYTTKDIYDAISDGEGGKVYLSDGVWLDENGDLS